MAKSVFGVIGLGVMGGNLSHNIIKNGFSLSVYNRAVEGEAHLVTDFLNEHKTNDSVFGTTQLEEFVASLERPRKIFIMIKAGSAIDYLIDQLLPLLSENDIVIDGGNSYYEDTNRRKTYLEKKGISYIGCGVSGGALGALNGPSLMVGGTHGAYNEVKVILESIAAKDKDNEPCCALLGPEGSGHFIKMIHNGIEYVEMQLLAELYALLSTQYSNNQIASIFSEWNESELNSYLLDITAQILTKKENGTYIIDSILDKAGNKGTGSWSSKVAFDLGSVNTMMASAVFARYISSFKTQREILSEQISTKREVEELNLETLKSAYKFARIINHYQGFEILRQASKAYNWSLNLSEIARVWTNGCIIRSVFMEQSIDLLNDGQSYLDHKSVINLLHKFEVDIKDILGTGLKVRISLSAFHSAYDYWIAMTTKRLPANLIQAQRDYFGAHTYQKIGHSYDEYFHTNWETI